MIKRIASKWYRTHPFLLASFPLLALLLHNLGHVAFRDVLIPALFIIGSTALIFVILAFLYRSPDRALIPTSIIVILFFSYGWVFAFIENRIQLEIGRFVIGPNKVLFLLLAFLMLVSIIVFFRSKSRFENLNKVLCVMSIALVLTSVLQIAWHLREVRELDSKYSVEQGENIGGEMKELSSRPDIYYIVLDEYAGHNTLNNLFSYDNKPFYGALEERGFYVAEESRSNYTQTFLSIASALNMKYLDSVPEKIGKDSEDWTMIYNMVRDSKTVYELRKFGYKFFTFRSGYAPTNFIKKADMNYQSGILDEFFSTLLQRTMLLPLVEQKIVDLGKRERILYALEKTRDIPEYNEPTFTLIHLVSPHSPYVFGSDGQEVEGTDEKNIEGVWSDARKSFYVGEVQYLNKEILKLVDDIISKSSEPPVIIVQGDHGSKSLGKWEGDDFARERLEIMNAYYIPSGTEQLYQTITPVNSFRVVLDQTISSDYGLVEDKSYFSTIEKPFDFSDVTEVLASSSYRAVVEKEI